MSCGRKFLYNAHWIYIESIKIDDDIMYQCYSDLYPQKELFSDESSALEYEIKLIENKA